jgi:hypothetical protein
LWVGNVQGIVADLYLILACFLACQESGNTHARPNEEADCHSGSPYH